MVKKVPGLLEEKECVRFQFLKDHQEQYNIKRACKTLHISRSGFYEYLKRKESDRAIENKILSQEIKHVFEEHKERYGCLRISKVLENEGLKINHKRVQKLMRSIGLYAKGTRYRYKHLFQRKKVFYIWQSF